MTINICRNLLKQISNVELAQREKNKPTLEIEISSLKEHFESCSTCQMEIDRLKPQVFPYLMKNFSKIF